MHSLGLPLKLRKLRLGHSTQDDITLDWCTHIRMAQEVDAAESISRAARAREG